MAIVRAVKTGLWSDPTVWNTGALPTADDSVYSNTFTVTIDISPTVLSISNAAASGVTAGGSFTASNGMTLTATGAGVFAGSTSTSCLQVTLTTGQSCSVVSKATSATGHGIEYVSGAGTLNVTGDCGVTSGGGYGVRSNSGSTVNITGNCAGVYNASNGIMNITGNCTGSSGTNSFGAYQFQTGTLSVVGNCTAGSGQSACGLLNNSTGSVTITGTITASNNANGFSSSNLGATVILSGPFIAASNGCHAVLCGNWKWPNSNVTPTYYQIRTANLATIRPLYTADSVGGNPATSNVRSGTIFGPNNELTGTCAVPPAASVGVGVPVDNTTGTAAITAASIRSAMGLAAADLDTQLAALPTAAEVRTEMDSNSTKLANLDATVSSRSTYAGADTSGTTTLLSRLTSGRAGNLDNLDATISSRLASSGYTAPPSVGDIAAAVWAAGTRTLTTTIASAGDVAAAVWSAVSRTITGGTVDTLTNAPSVPSASTIASQVRTELSTELGRIDVATSTRLAGNAYSAAPAAATVATAVRSELATELGRIDAAVSTRLAPGGTLARVTLTDTTTTVTNSSQVDNAAIAEAVRTELQPELNRVANCSTTQEVGDIVEEAMNP